MLRTASPLPLYRAFDAGLRPGPFPDRAASLLPGLLAATRTGLPPAGDDELTNTKKHHGLTSRCHLLLCWAHEKRSLSVVAGEALHSPCLPMTFVIASGASSNPSQSCQP